MPPHPTAHRHPPVSSSYKLLGCSGKRLCWGWGREVSKGFAIPATPALRPFLQQRAPFFGEGEESEAGNLATVSLTVFVLPARVVDFATIYTGQFSNSNQKHSRNSTGDIVDGRPLSDLAQSSNIPSSTARDSWRAPFLALIQPLLDAEPPIPWTFCPGNHDDDRQVLSLFALLVQ